MTNTPNTTESQQDLNILYSLVPRKYSHYQYVITQPLARSQLPIFKKWAQIVRRAANGFLADLMTNHRSCTNHLRLHAGNQNGVIHSKSNGRSKSRKIKNHC